MGQLSSFLVCLQHDRCLLCQSTFTSKNCWRPSTVFHREHNSVDGKMGVWGGCKTAANGKWPPPPILRSLFSVNRRFYMDILSGLVVQSGGDLDPGWSKWLCGEFLTFYLVTSHHGKTAVDEQFQAQWRSELRMGSTWTCDHVTTRGWLKWQTGWRWFLLTQQIGCRFGRMHTFKTFSFVLKHKRQKRGECWKMSVCVCVCE